MSSGRDIDEENRFRANAPPEMAPTKPHRPSANVGPPEESSPSTTRDPSSLKNLYSSRPSSTTRSARVGLYPSLTDTGMMDEESSHSSTSSLQAVAGDYLPNQLQSVLKQPPKMIRQATPAMERSPSAILRQRRAVAEEMVARFESSPSAEDLYRQAMQSDSDDDADASSIDSLQTEDGGVIAIGVVAEEGPPPSAPAPRTDEEANQQVMDAIVAENVAESEHWRKHAPAKAPAQRRSRSNNTDDDVKQRIRDSMARGPSLALGRVSSEDAPEDRKLAAEAGPSLAAAISSASYRSSAAVAVGWLPPPSKELDDMGPRLAPALATGYEEDDEDDDEEGIEEIEVQAALPVCHVGAFAVQGIQAGRSQTLYTSDDDEEGQDRPSSHFAVASTEFDEEAPPLQAELQVVVEGAVVSDDDDEPDPKSLRRLRLIQASVVCFSLAALALIIGSILGFVTGGASTEDQPLGWTQVGQNLYGPLGEQQTLFGASVALAKNGTRLAVATPGADDGMALNTGQIRVFDAVIGHNGTMDWQESAILMGTDASQLAISSLTMTDDGGRLVVGRAQLEGDIGKVIVYDYNGDWNQSHEWMGEDWWGQAVAIEGSGRYLAIGAPLAGEDQQGMVVVYEMTTMTQVGSNITGSMVNELLGWSVAIAGGADDRLRVAVGGPSADAETGIVRVFELMDGDWKPLSTPMVGPKPLSRFGEAVDLSADGTVLAVGARGIAFELGSAHVFHLNGGQWIGDTDVFVGQQASDGYGASVALSRDGQMLVIGSPQSDGMAADSGSVEVYEYIDTKWTMIGRRLEGAAGGHWFGASVDIDGALVAVGAPSATFDGSIAQAGTVAVYERDE